MYLNYYEYIIINTITIFIICILINRMVSVKVGQKSAGSHTNNTFELEWIWFITKISINFYRLCLQIQATLQNANVFNKSFNYVMNKQWFKVVWDEFSSVQQSDQIRAIKEPQLVERSARACWDDFIGNVCFMASFRAAGVCDHVCWWWMMYMRSVAVHR